MNPPVLVPPVPGRPLILYMTVLDESMGVYASAARRVRKEGTSHLLLKQEVHSL